ncbi:hypothetical protein ARMSODRAFT_462908 [Armillaria solidipes]|uniref:Uncharacterized protein n=1 Tax=Armillaria solidipes TaxID=1076256 RepID=A0A2H3BN32_9AGAR|nr:hypothetical protein ARMSODRAFT_462908 [Armillaria solidipes]
MANTLLRRLLEPSSRKWSRWTGTSVTSTLRNLSSLSPAVQWLSTSSTVAMTGFVGAYSTVTSTLAFDINTEHHSTNLASELDDTSFTRSAGLPWGREV